MKKPGLLSEILNAVVNHERKKADKGGHNEILDQKKQLWYGLMNQIDEPAEDQEEKSSS
ncbi:MAG: hypothetical protein IJ646_07985 [Clostridia bacterium]|nr:hypothetical protein [Clostridia bacterium]